MEKGNAVKNLIKKNQLMITALAIMIAIAGYLQFAGTNLEKEYLASDNTEDLSAVDSTDIVTDMESLDSDVEIVMEDYLDEDMQVAEATPDEGEIPGEAVLTGTNGVEVLSAARLSKEQTRARNKETLLEIINSTELSDAQKQEAVDSMVRMTDIAEKEAAAARDVEIPEEGNSCDRMERLSGDEEFTALLYAVQQYLGKTFTQIECEKFAFFYDGLKMSGDLLEYLAEYCAGGGHSSIRYIEKVALNWYQMGIHTREEARDYTMRYSRDTSAVMKAFGITGRSPATAETEFMKRWFKEFGFDCKLVTEACGRTIKATGTASFPYADKILTGWKEAGVKTLGDVEELDRRRQASKRQDRREPGNGRGQETGRKPAGSNRFKNFEERTYNYEDYVWEDMRRRQQKGGRMDGTE